MAKQLKTSWENSAKWYDDTVGEKGHYYHEHVIFPRLLEMMELKNSPELKLLDLACGQGILSRQLPPKMGYVGVDLAKSLIQAAKARTKSPHHKFFTHDVSKKITLPAKDFSHATIILALQNIEHPVEVLKNAAGHLKQNGKLFIVLNHPCFRIPRQTHWGFDDQKKLQYRRLDSYLSSQKIPIQTHPGKKNSAKTLSFHHPISAYTKWLREAGFVVTEMEEWVSDKKSTGGRARMENRARKEFPLFLTLACQKT